MNQKPALKVFCTAILIMCALSFLGILFISNSFKAFGFIAFLLVFIVFFSRHGSRRIPFNNYKIYYVVAPLFLAGFLMITLATGMRGSPKLGEKAVFAQREHYVFSHGSEGPRSRFVVAATGFHLAWHSLLFGFALDMMSPKIEKRRKKQDAKP